MVPNVIQSVQCIINDDGGGDDSNITLFLYRVLGFLKQFLKFKFASHKNLRKQEGVTLILFMWILRLKDFKWYISDHIDNDDKTITIIQFVWECCFILLLLFSC